MSNENPRLTAENLNETMASHTVRFNEVVPDWEPFLKPPVPDNHRAIFQYIGMNGHGRVDPWVARSERISLSLIYLLLPLPWSLNVFCLAHLFFAGSGMYALAHRWTGSRFGAA